jgi:hypothetical protein
MGFLSDLGNAFMGKPIGSDEGIRHGNQESPRSNQHNGVLDEQGRKIIPDIDFKNLRSQRQGSDRLIVKSWVVNPVDQEIRIDTSYLLKQKRTHNQHIGPRDSREITLYDGKIPDNDNETSAQVAYRLQVNGDVFMENYRVDYNLESDGKFIVSDLIDDGPVRDI